MRFTSNLILLMSLTVSAHSLWATEPPPPGPEFYRGLTERVRKSATFKIPMPGGQDLSFSYKLAVGPPKFALPMVSELDSPGTAGNAKFFYRVFFDKMYLKDGSFIQVGSEQIPLTCVFIDGQDNRFSGGESPLLPNFVLKIYLVANDYTCTGPINPGSPENGQKKESWDTYIYFEIRDPTIMLPTETVFRYRWNQFSAVLVDAGDGSP